MYVEGYVHKQQKTERVPPLLLQPMALIRGKCTTFASPLFSLCHIQRQRHRHGPAMELSTLQGASESKEKVDIFDRAYKKKQVLWSF
jgi:hypothetical protein